MQVACRYLSASSFTIVPDLLRVVCYKDQNIHFTCRPAGILSEHEFLHDLELMRRNFKGDRFCFGYILQG
jgi:hypothetical protein